MSASVTRCMILPLSCLDCIVYVVDVSLTFRIFHIKHGVYAELVCTFYIVKIVQV